jgi:hypothetical protein
MARHELDALLRELARSPLRFVIIGGIAVGVHGYVRATRDIDIRPSPDADNLVLLAAILRELPARQLGIEDFTAAEQPLDPLDPADLAQGGNFRLQTRLGDLDIMQWVAGIDDDNAFAALNADAVEVVFDGERLRVCSLANLRRMKEAAARPQDLLDLEQLPAG